MIGTGERAPYIAELICNLPDELNDLTQRVAKELAVKKLLTQMDKESKTKLKDDVQPTSEVIKVDAR